jgi:hypothetical protein
MYKPQKAGPDSQNSTLQRSIHLFKVWEVTQDHLLVIFAKKEIKKKWYCKPTENVIDRTIDIHNHVDEIQKDFCKRNKSDIKSCATASIEHARKSKTTARKLIRHSSC